MAQKSVKMSQEEKFANIQAALDEFSERIAL